MSSEGKDNEDKFERLKRRFEVEEKRPLFESQLYKVTMQERPGDEDIREVELEAPNSLAAIEIATIEFGGFPTDSVVFQAYVIAK